MGRFNKYQYERWSSKQSGKLLGEHFYFIELNKQLDGDDSYERQANIKTFKSINDYFIEVIDSSCTSNYAKLMDHIEKSPIYSPIDELKTTYIEYTLIELIKSIKKDCYHKSIYLKKINDYKCFYIRNDDKKISCWSYDDPHNGYQSFDSVEQFFNTLKPYYRNTYLINNKLFETSK
jgi:hypothetical protein